MHTHRKAGLGMLVVGVMLLAASAPSEARKPGGLEKCPWTQSGQLRPGADFKPDTEFLLSEPCNVPASPPGHPWVFGNVHILEGGVLNFTDAKIEFWAKAILVEKNGALTAGVPGVPITGPVTIHLYGDDKGAAGDGGAGILCATPLPNHQPDHYRCGVPQAIWESNAATKDCLGDCHPGDPNDAKKISDPTVDPNNQYLGPVRDDYFYPYHALMFDGAKHGTPASVGYFGYKVLGVSYGGTLQLFGRKGSCTSNCDDPANTGTSWVRLAATVRPSDHDSGSDTTTLRLSAAVDWKAGDRIVLTTTDYLPGHSEELELMQDASGSTVVVKVVKPDGTLGGALKHIHNGKPFPLSDVTNISSALQSSGAETRAAVGLLTRSIRIVSEGSAPCADGHDTCFPANSYFGGHVVIRQGFKVVQIQGVEFKQLGQGGRTGHYPVHFHHARKTQNTYVKDSSINESMTRWIVLHGTQDVLLQRNVGWKSIGHGFYLEDGTEINNKLYANLGIFARAAVANVQNPRQVPGILVAPDTIGTDGQFFPYKSDVDNPTVFWIMNGWNDFQHNMAAGAGTCGACYWFVSAVNSTMSSVNAQGNGPRWESYASQQSTADRWGATPLKSFVGNFCTSAMTSFQTVTATAECHGVAPAGFGPYTNIQPIKNDLAPNHPDPTYYPTVHPTGGRAATQCGGVNADPHADCSTAQLNSKCDPGDITNCVVTVLDRYTTSFNWAAFNFAAIWLRPQWYLVTDSVITDVQQGGLTMVTGGGYSSSDIVPGHWALVRKSVFIGNTQDCPTCEITDNPLASNGGPFNPKGLQCTQFTDKTRPGNFCSAVDEGVSFQIDNYGMYQRLFSVYDGPAYQDSNAYINITSRKLDDCVPLSSITPPPHNTGICDPPDKSKGISSAWWAGTAKGVLKMTPDPNDKKKDYCYLPNAAIGWKQPNGFYYPPAFHSANLFFKNVETRHFVVTPLFKETLEGSFQIDIEETDRQYCVFSPDMFDPFTSIDRQTVLNDDDGTLTGYTGSGTKKTIAVNLDDFFTAPVEAIQCASAESSRTSPYAYVTTVVYPRCLTEPGKSCGIDPGVTNNIPNPNPHTGDWDFACSNQNCYGVPLYRLDLTKSDKGVPKVIRMTGGATGQRSILTVNHGAYYLDTSITKATQMVDSKGQQCDDPTTFPKECNISVFRGEQTYYVFLIYAKDDTTQTYRFYVGPGKTDDPSTELGVHLVQADIGPNPVVFKDVKSLDASQVKWINKGRGIVEVVLSAADLGDFAGKMTLAQQDDCQPKSYCAWDSGSKTCRQCTAFNADGSCKTMGDDQICKWAVADPHCPKGGCVGFRFTIPAGFVNSNGPKPQELVSLNITKDTLCSDTAFHVSLDKNASAGACPQDKDRMELNFTDVKPDNCQDVNNQDPFPRCKCP